MRLSQQQHFLLCAGGQRLCFQNVFKHVLKPLKTISVLFFEKRKKKATTSKVAKVVNQDDRIWFGFRSFENGKKGLFL